MSTSSEICIMAIDPGLTGAVAYYFPSTAERVAVDDMPVVNGEVDPHALGASDQATRPDDGDHRTAGPPTP